MLLIIYIFVKMSNFEQFNQLLMVSMFNGVLERIGGTGVPPIHTKLSYFSDFEKCSTLYHAFAF